LRDKVAALVGSDGLAQYQEYSKNIISTLTAAQFKGNLTGDGEAKAEKEKLISQAMQEETRSALAAAGLPADFQPVPTLNFRNIASEETADRDLKLIEGISERVGARASTFLSAEELTKWLEFWKTALEQNRAALAMNRKLMAPIGK
jgi:hypothetical protein